MNESVHLESDANEGYNVHLCLAAQESSIMPVDILISLDILTPR